MAAATAEMLQQLQSQITCSICWNYFCEPVSIGCGHSFCRACLPSSTATVFSCPECRQVSQVRDFPLINGSLVELTKLGKQLSSQLVQSAGGQRRCATHHQALEFFCEDEQMLLCQSCCQNPEHGAHRLSSVQEAASNCRKKIQHLHSCLQKYFKETKKLLVKEKRPVIDWQEMIRREYLEWDSFMWPEECHHLERMKQEKKNKKARLSQQRRSLQDLMLDLQEAECQPSLDLLRDVKQLLQRSESVLSQRAKALIPEVRVCPISGMIETLNQFRVDVRMEPTSASPCLIVAEDLKSVRAGQGWQLDSQSADDPDLPIVLAEKAYTSDRQYWEVDLTQLPQWTLGIHTSYLRIKNPGRVTKCVSIFFLRCVKKEDGYYLQSYPGSLNHKLNDPIPRIGVYLEYKTGTLAFYNVLQSSLIYQLPDISFIAPVTPMFSPGPPLPGTKPGAMTLCPVDSHLCACCYSSL
ncbi:probable E3 ubiquitin-protein ligase TRIML1 [Antechinus flavipes]|uniref:probable E3 ubiquitin-protein ligase TRIML1 n=1 Tax=Antechinus flavipes TaxID=38775 RepID=UPI002235B1DB|nr:probable E3 ubiquitin-protein ligase TRIML1 [Antechinus flavipes]